MNVWLNKTIGDDDKKIGKGAGMFIYFNNSTGRSAYSALGAARQKALADEFVANNSVVEWSPRCFYLFLQEKVYSSCSLEKRKKY